MTKPLTPTVAPLLSTPDTRIFEDRPDTSALKRAKEPDLSDDQFCATYEISRTVKEIREGRRRRIALQFPDHLLVDAPRVSKALSRGLHAATEEVVRGTNTSGRLNASEKSGDDVKPVTNGTTNLTLDSGKDEEPEKLFILVDTSYGACCVDEIAAEHASADAVVHYGRTCLSPTSRLPVIYVFTRPYLALEPVVAAFKELYPERDKRILLMADVPYMYCVPELAHVLVATGYPNVFATHIVQDTSSPLPNRTIPPEAREEPSILQSWELFHISEPPESLLLSLSSRVSSIYSYPTTPALSTVPRTPICASTSATLHRRYALLTRLSTVPIFGILINTLSVRNYMSILAHVKSRIAAAGKKSYTFVVGKVNPAKIANFAEVGGWVVVGCWESSLFDSKEFWRPIITPWELEVALSTDEERVWTGAWESDWEGVLRRGGVENVEHQEMDGDETARIGGADGAPEEVDSEEESEPPDFDLRTGQYVSRTRPLPRKKKVPNGTADLALNGSRKPGDALIKRERGDVIRLGATASPAADFLHEKRSWRGLGSDFPIEYDEETCTPKAVEGALMEQGRCGIAKGYTVGSEISRH